MRAQALPNGTLDGKVTLFTGGGTGFGQAIAVRFGTLHARLVLVSGKTENLERGATPVRAQKARC